MEITLDEIDSAILFLRTRAAAQARELSAVASSAYLNELRPAHARLVQEIYRMTLIRNGLIAERDFHERLQ